VRELAPEFARRVALAAQGFTDRRHETVTMRTLDRVIARTGVFQIDSVNVLQRAHYMPLFSRQGRYDTGLLHRAAGRSPRRLVEYWAHEAAFMPVDLWPYMQHRMATASTAAWGGPRRVAAERPELLDWVRDEVREQGPVTARDIELDLPRSRDDWGWNWSLTKQALEYLFYAGELTVAGRNSQFERMYDVPERVIPETVLRVPTPEPDDARRELVSRAARSLGVGTAKCLRDYYRMPVEGFVAALEELVEEGDLIPVSVPGWSKRAYLHRDAAQPRRVASRALLSPFDPLVWERSRTEGLFGFRYRIEIYVPEGQRVHGYYVLPFLLGDRLVARVDLKADRAAGVLRVPGAFAEADAPEETAHELASALLELADWLDLDDVLVGTHGGLARDLGLALRRT